MGSSGFLHRFTLLPVRALNGRLVRLCMAKMLAWYVAAARNGGRIGNKLDVSCVKIKVFRHPQNHASKLHPCRGVRRSCCA
ncbi:hypothetical protein B0T13DRAFT_475624 [Neurospora crassa]|nr:hypothetical protein B0T13DRAFT_475624 [Neurospora crassa]